MSWRTIFKQHSPRWNQSLKEVPVTANNIDYTQAAAWIQVNDKTMANPSKQSTDWLRKPTKVIVGI